MNVDELTLDARILQELAEIKVSQDHMRSDIAEIKTDLRIFREEKAEMDERLREIEQYQAECRGTRGTAKTAIYGFAVIVASMVSAAVSAAIGWLSK